MRNTYYHPAGLRFYATILFICLVLAGCDQGPQTEPLPEAPNEQLAYAVAAALGNPDVRESVHQAMDASPYVEHKLVLQAFLESPEGSDLQGALSNVLGGDQRLTDLLADLPELDFYLPYETHRETWEHANHNLWAVCVLDTDAKEGIAYHPDGSSRVLDSREQVRQAEVAALFSLHPAEGKIPRNAEAAAPAGISGMQADKDDWKTGVSKITNYSNDGTFGGACEFYFKSSTDGGGDYTSDQVSVDSYDGVAHRPSEKTISTPLKVHPDGASNSNHISVHMWEADSGLAGGDDDYGTFDVSGSDELDSERAFGDGTPWTIVSFVVD